MFNTKLTHCVYQKGKWTYWLLAVDVQVSREQVFFNKLVVCYAWGCFCQLLFRILFLTSLLSRRVPSQENERARVRNGAVHEGWIWIVNYVCSGDERPLTNLLLDLGYLGIYVEASRCKDTRDAYNYRACNIHYSHSHIIGYRTCKLRDRLSWISKITRHWSIKLRNHNDYRIWKLKCRYNMPLIATIGWNSHDHEVTSSIVEVENRAINTMITWAIFASLTTRNDWKMQRGKKQKLSTPTRNCKYT